MEQEKKQKKDPRKLHTERLREEEKKKRRSKFLAFTKSTSGGRTSRAGSESVRVPSMTAGVVLRYTISRSRHCDRCADWLGFSLRGVALRRSLSMYITSLWKQEAHVHGTGNVQFKEMYDSVSTKKKMIAGLPFPRLQKPTSRPADD